MKIFTKRKILTSTLITMTLVFSFATFLPSYLFANDNLPIFPNSSFYKYNNPGTITNPINDNELNLVTLSEEYGPPAYTGIGDTYTVTETFNEVIEYATSASNLRYNNPVAIPIDGGTPSQDANKVFGTVISLIEDHPNAFNNPFTSDTENWTAYESGPAADLSRMSETWTSGSVRIAMDGIKDSGSVTLDDDDGFDADMDQTDDWTFTESSTSDTGDHSTGSRSYGYSTYGGESTYWFELEEDGYTTLENHDIWCNYDTVQHADSDTHYFYITSPNFQHGYNTGLGGGYEITGATLSVRSIVNSEVRYTASTNDANLYVYLSTNGGSSYSSHEVWTEGDTSSYNIENWDVTSLLQSTTYNTNLRIQFRFYAYLYADNSNDDQDIDCNIDYVYLTINYNQARQFSSGSEAGFQSDTYQYLKNTIDGNFTFSYRLPALWDDTTGNTAACDHAEAVLYMSSTASSPSGADVWTHSLDDDGLFVKDNAWHAITDAIIPLEIPLGTFGAVSSFYFRLTIRWTDNWGPLTDSNLNFDFDNLKFDFTASVRPDEVGLYLRETVQGDIAVTNTGFGTGTFDSGAAWSWTGTYNGGTTPSFQWVITDPYCRGSTNIIIGYGDIYMAESNTTLATTSFSCAVNATNDWYLTWNSSQKRMENRTSSEQMDITGVPNDWGAAYTNINPITNATETASRPAVGTLRVTGSTSNTLYTFTASSPNKLNDTISSIRIQEDTGGWTNRSIVYPTNNTRLRVKAFDDNGYLNMTIMNASRTGPDFTGNFGIEHNQKFDVGTSVTYSTPWVIPLDSIPGKWIYVLWWNNSLTPGQITEVGHVTIVMDVRRRTTTTEVMFSQVDSGLVGNGSDLNKPANITLDGDPLYINITWTDDHWGTPVNYYETANITIDADYPTYDDKPPYTTNEFEMSRDGSNFYYKIGFSDYFGWCYTGSHNFTIELFSESTEIDGELDSRKINGSFFVMVDIRIEPTFPNPLPVIDEYDQGDPLNLLVYIYDESHNKLIDNNSFGSEYYGLVTVNWSLVLGNATIKNLIRTLWAQNETSGLLSQKVPGTFDAVIDIDSACEATDEGSSNWWEQYYYLNFSVTIARNDSLDWEFEQVYLMNESTTSDERMVGTPYEKLKWVKFSVEEAEYKFVVSSDVTWAEDPIQQTDIDVYWYDWDNDNITIYVRYYGLEDDISRPFSGLNSHVGFVNSTYYNDSIALREGNVSYLRENLKRVNAGDVSIRSEAEGTAWNKDWIEAIPYRWTGDTGGHYSLVPEINTTDGYYTGNLIPWDINNNLTWGWYYQNFTVHKALARQYTLYITCQKLDKVWYNETMIGGANPPYKFGKVVKTLDIDVNDNPVVLIQRNNHLIHDTTDLKYYWNDILTLNLTAWDALNNGTVTADHPDGSWEVEGFDLEFDLIDMASPLTPINASINIPEINGKYVAAYSTYSLEAQEEAPGKEFKFKIIGDLQNYTIDDDGTPPIIPQKEITFFLNSRPTSLDGVDIGGVMEKTEDLGDILAIYENLTLDASGYKASPYLIPKNRIFTMSFFYNDTCTRNGGPINDAYAWINITEGAIPALPGIYWEDNLADNNDGIYNFTIDTTGLKINTEYRVTLSAKKVVTSETNYQQYKISPAERFFNIKVLPIPVVMEEAMYPVATQGELLFIVLKVTDPTATGNSPKNLRGANIEYEIKGPGINPLIPVLGFMVDMGNGLYITSLDTWDSFFDPKEPGMYIFEARLKGFSNSFDPNDDYGNYNDYDTAAMLTTNQRSLIININSAGPFGPLTGAMILGVIGTVAVVGAYSTYYTIRILRVPYPLRMIEDTDKKIKRRRKTHAGIMKSREQQITEEAEVKLSIFGVKLEPISPKKLPPPITKVIKKEELEKELSPLTEEQIKADLEKITDLTSEEKRLFLKEIKDLSPSDQREFIAGLKGETKEEETKKE